MAAPPLPCPTLLRQILSLEDGVLRWRRRPEWMFKFPSQSRVWNDLYAGKPVSLEPKGKGYFRVQMMGRRHILLHRVLFAYYNGRWPSGPVDHRNGDTGDNSESNLREATISQNNMNRANVGKSSQYRGVYKDRNLWQVKCSDPQGKNRYIGKFKCEIEAAKAFDAAAKMWHGEFARVNFP